MNQLRDFFVLLWLYRHNPRNAVRIAYEIAFKKAPF
jgi:hypothetical protein